MHTVYLFFFTLLKKKYEKYSYNNTKSRIKLRELRLKLIIINIKSFIRNNVS